MAALEIRQLGLTDYAHTLAEMQAFTAQRNDQTPDQLWITEHPPVYTLGLNRRGVRLPQNGIAVISVDRGGKITYHGPGQLIIYCLIDLHRRHLNVRALVSILENSLIEFLAAHGIVAVARTDAPGVYVNEKKIASLGLRLKNQCCYHGLSLNIEMDLQPFADIDPCGYAGMQMTQTRDLNIALAMSDIAADLTQRLKVKLTHVRT
ncbi:lipoyl(octanoyl) transferase LipB [Methylophilus medardicus]|uniref:Octanoyltransferase n=1 Tax=Methylophilus medardicus TaxID=2588534 RepID=A0A5B8CPF8_9PROT|nr:lipoyl(octanoyl) transferase LipB [Methylophilus medardicus]QDC43114.1 lipoyl(octanoyl) transferase LipB [Methylophilus medardicus]QDC48121.1 lipoyl(octanoyl) transferase LipB [Methylophilus medardicus]QDC51826.1 lipoyl(octanoyl) transferase LipB [Methylophilus medardicus]